VLWRVRRLRSDTVDKKEHGDDEPTRSKGDEHGQSSLASPKPVFQRLAKQEEAAEWHSTRADRDSRALIAP
jgi:hypothetical protein